MENQIELSVGFSKVLTVIAKRLKSLVSAFLLRNISSFASLPLHFRVSYIPMAVHRNSCLPPLNTFYWAFTGLPAKFNSA